MSITVNGLPIGSGTPGPNSVGSLEIIDDSVESVDIQDGTITVADLAFNPFAKGPSDYTIVTMSQAIDPDLYDLVIADSTTGALVIQMPVAPTDGTFLSVKWFAGGNPVSVDGNGNSIDNAPSYTLQYIDHAINLTYSSFLGEWVIT